MIKKIKYVLLTFLSLGFLQLETLAMPGEEENTITQAYTGIARWSEETNARITALENTEQQRSGRIENEALTGTSRELQQQITSLLQENATLRSRVIALESPREITATLSYRHYDYWFCGLDPSVRFPVKFEEFKGDEDLRGPDLTAVKIPRDGRYDVVVEYHWRSSNNSNSAPESAIAINNPGNFAGRSYLIHYLAPNGVQRGTLNYVCDLRMDDLVMFSMKPATNAECYLNDFRLKIRKIN